MGDSVLSTGERAVLEAFGRHGVRYLIVGMGAALLQGARGATEDIDLWIESSDDPRLRDIARDAGGFWISGFGMRPPGFGGSRIGDRFDIVTHVHGVGAFDDEYASAPTIELERLLVKVLPLARIRDSKRALGRPRDLAQIPALEEALAVGEDNPDE